MSQFRKNFHIFSIIYGLILCGLNPPFALADLVIIDMQPCFLEDIDESKQEEIIQNILSKIEHAKTLGEIIVFVEFTEIPESKTHPELLKAVAGYKNILFVSKDSDDGSTQIKKELDEKKVSPKTIDICGINTFGCVMATVNGLVQIMPDLNITVEPQSCWDVRGIKAHENGLTHMAILTNVEVKGFEQVKDLYTKTLELRTYLDDLSYFVSEKRVAYRTIKKLLSFVEEGLPIADRFRKLSEHPDRRVRISLSRAFQALKPQNLEVLAFLKKLSLDPDKDVREAALIAYGRPLAGNLFIMRAIGEAGMANEVRFLSHLLMDPEENIQRAVCSILWNIEMTLELNPDLSDPLGDEIRRRFSSIQAGVLDILKDFATKNPHRASLIGSVLPKWEQSAF